MKNITIASLAIAATAFAANADVQYSADLDVDNTGTGGLAGNILVHNFSMGALDSIDSISMELSSTWGGDFIINLTSDQGASFQLMNVNPGGSTFGDNFEMGVAGFGELSDVATYNFVASGGGALSGTGLVGAGDYNAVVWDGGAIAAANWTLTVDDNANGDTNAVGNFTVNGTVPAPSSMALLGLGGLVAGRRRR